MSSLLGAPFQMTNMTSEILFVLDNRLRQYAATREIPEYVRTEIFENIAGKMFEALNAFFTLRSLLTIDEQKIFFRSCMDHRYLKITQENFEKLFEIAVMAVKVQILRCNHLIDIVSVSEDKLREVRDILQSRKMREEATRLKDTFLGFYSSLGVGETIRLRHTLLNLFGHVNQPIAALIAEGYQVEDGDLTVSVHGQNSTNLGATTVYNLEGTIVDEYVLPIAGKSGSETRLYDGPWNLFSHRKGPENGYDRGLLSNDISTPSDSLLNEVGFSKSPEFIDREDTRFLIDSELVGEQVFSPNHKRLTDNQSNVAVVSYAERLRATKVIYSPCQENTSDCPFR